MATTIHVEIPPGLSGDVYITFAPQQHEQDSEDENALSNEELFRCCRMHCDEAQQGQTCSICLEPIGYRYRRLHCSHVFHSGCILQWLGRARHCPVCRQDVTRR